MNWLMVIMLSLLLLSGGSIVGTGETDDGSSVSFGTPDGPGTYESRRGNHPDLSGGSISFGTPDGPGESIRRPR